MATSEYRSTLVPTVWSWAVRSVMGRPPKWGWPSVVRQAETLRRLGFFPGIDRIQQQPGSELRVEERGFLRHDLTGVGDGLQLLDAGGGEQEHGLNGRPPRLLQRRLGVLHVAQVRLALLRRAVDAQHLLENQRVQDGDIQPAQRGRSRRPIVLSGPQREREEPAPGG